MFQCIRKTNLTRLICALVVCLGHFTSLCAQGASETPPDKVQKATWLAHVLRQKNSPMISELEFPQTKLPVFMVQNKGTLRPLVELRGNYLREGWKLLIQEKSEVRKGARPNEFVIYAYLNSRINEVMLTAKGPDGKIEKETVYLFAPEAMEFKLVSAWDAVLVSVGLASLSYYQNTYGQYYGTSMALSASYSSPEKWGAFGFTTDLDLTFMSIQSSPVDANPQLMEAKIDGTYLLPQGVNSFSRWKILAGSTFLTMQSSGSSFGFSTLIGAELGVHLDHFINKERSYFVDFRTALFNNPSLEDGRSINLSVGWSKMLSNLKRFEVSAELIDYAFRPDEINLIKVNTLFLKVGYSL